MWLLPPQHNWIATIQALGFVLVGFFLVSIYQNRAKRFLNSKCSSLSYLSLKHAIIFHGLLIHEPSPFILWKLIRTRECYACIF